MDATGFERKTKRKAVRWQVHGPGATPLGIAGIYRKWRHPDGREVLTLRTAGTSVTSASLQGDAAPRNSDTLHGIDSPREHMS